MSISLMKAADASMDRDKIRFPVYASEKLDGIRCHVAISKVSGKRILYSRTNKPIPNLHIRNTVQQSTLPVGIEGELIIGPTFQDTTSAVMSVGGEPDFRFNIIEYQHDSMTFRDRYAYMASVYRDCTYSWLNFVYQQKIESLDLLHVVESEILKKGGEGLMLHSPDGRYKFGQCSMLTQELMKLKKFIDTEARVMGFEEMQRKGNSDKPTWKLGALVARCDYLFDRLSFNVGSGFQMKEREELWRDREKYLGKYFTFKYQAAGTKNLPRTPIFLHWREDIKL